MKTTWKFVIGKIRNKFAFHVLHRSFHNLVDDWKRLLFLLFGWRCRSFFFASLWYFAWFFFAFFCSALHANVKRTCVWLHKMRNYELGVPFIRLLAYLLVCAPYKRWKARNQLTAIACMLICSAAVGLCCKFYNSKTKIQPRKCERKRKRKKANENESNSEMGVEAKKTNPWFFKVDPLCTVFWSTILKATSCHLHTHCTIYVEWLEVVCQQQQFPILYKILYTSGKSETKQ